MKNDLKLIRSKIRAANKLPESNPKDYNLKQDILRHWRGEQYMMKAAIEQDQLMKLRPLFKKGRGKISTI